MWNKEFKTPKKQKYDILPLEIAHCTLPLENNDKNAGFIKFLSENFHSSEKGNQMPVFEDIVSGRGIFNAYAYENQESSKVLKEIGKDHVKREEIIKSIAKNCKNNPENSKIMKTYCEFLMLTAQSLCVTIPKMSGVLFCGGNQVENSDFFKENVEELHKIFLDHPKREWLNKVSFFSQSKKHNFNLAGCRAYAEQHLLRGIL